MQAPIRPITSYNPNRTKFPGSEPTSSLIREEAYELPPHKLKQIRQAARQRPSEVIVGTFKEVSSEEVTS